MNIELWPLSQVKPYPNNPRVNDDAVNAVAASIREFGFRQPIVVDGEGVIVVGHTRYKAALKLGLEKVPVHVAKDLTPEQIKAYRIADNKTADLAEWNYDLLPIELAELQGMNYDLGLLGFDEYELVKLLNPGVKEGLCDPDEVPEPPDEATTRPGDLWLLGEHRLLCGDSGKAEDVDRLLGGAAIHLVNTDPPYNVKVEPRSNNAIAAGLSSFGDSNTQPQNHHQAFDVARQGPKVPTHKKLRPKDRPLANDFVSEEAFEKLLHAWFGNIARVLLPGRAFYIWGGYANLGNYPPVLKAHGLYFSQGIVWDKEHPVLTRFGLYLAQGHLQSAGHGDRRYPAFSLHKRRQDLMERIWAKWPRAREYDHNDYRPEPTSGTVVMAVDGDAGERFEALGGRLAYGKRLAPECFALPRSKRAAILQGWLNGDGCVVHDRTYWQGSTVFADLAAQLCLLAESVGYRANVYSYDPPEELGGISQRRFQSQRRVYHLYFYELGRLARRGCPLRLEHDGREYSLRRVKHVEQVRYSGT